MDESLPAQDRHFYHPITLGSDIDAAEARRPHLTAYNSDPLTTSSANTEWIGTGGSGALPYPNIEPAESWMDFLRQEEPVSNQPTDQYIDGVPTPSCGFSSGHSALSSPHITSAHVSEIPDAIRIASYTLHPNVEASTPSSSRSQAFAGATFVPQAFPANDVRHRKRRLTESIPSGRERVTQGTIQGPSQERRPSASASKPVMASSPLVDLTSPAASIPTENWNRGNELYGMRRSSLNVEPGGRMRVDSSWTSRYDGATHSTTDGPTRSTGFVMPKWQPDSEVSNCPVCKTQFTFFYRKHHCRKCGRVVCAACSPHRITLPYQFIVQPPAVIDLTEADADINIYQATNHELDPTHGGAQVRVCNPCVPDPNFSPLYQERTAHQQAPSLHGHLRNDALWNSLPANPSNGGTQHAGQFTGFAFPSTQAFPDWVRQESQTPMQNQQHRSHWTPNPDRFTDNRVTFTNPSSLSDLFPPPAQRQRAFATNPGIPFPPPPVPRSTRPTNQSMMPSSGQLIAPRTSSRAHQFRHSIGGAIPGGAIPGPAGASVSLAGPRYRSLLGPLPPNPPASALPLQIHSRSQPPAHGGPQSVPQRQIAEEDECPVCGNELPPKGSDGSEADRERHVEDCIASHFVPSSSSRPTSLAVPSSVSDPTLPQTLSPAAVSTSAPSGIGISGSSSHTPTDLLQRNASGSVPEPQRRRATGNRMLVCTATEKDCVGEDGGAAECIICFEEFEPGTELGRLECLCKFHRTCIRQWWDTKGVGSCPTHQLHD